MSDSDDSVVFVRELGQCSSKGASLSPRRSPGKYLRGATARVASAWEKSKAASSQNKSASSVLLSTWIDSARKDAASTKRMDARRKAAGVSSPAKRPKRSKCGDPIDTITLDDEDEVIETKEDKGIIKEEKKVEEVAGSVVTAASILSPRSPNKKVSPANSQASQGSRVGSSAAPSICDDETQENDEAIATDSQEARRALLRECLRVDYGRNTLRDGDVVRNRADRATMHGRDCPCCSEYYDQLGMDAEERQRRIDQVSRHRYVARPMPRTPPHYWDMDFPSEEEQIARGMITRRVSGGEEEVKDQEEEEKTKDQPEEKEED